MNALYNKIDLAGETMGIVRSTIHTNHSYGAPLCQHGKAQVTNALTAVKPDVAKGKLLDRGST